MKEEELTHSDATRKNVLFGVLKTVRKATWERYLIILLMASEPNGATMNEISLKLGEKPQTVHRLLKKMVDRKALGREKQGAEFYYHLTLDISKELIESVLQAVADEGAIDVEPLLDLEVSESIEESQVEEYQLDVPEDNLEASQVMNVQEYSGKSDRNGERSHENKQPMEWQKEIIQMRISKLPDFNPEWPVEMQNAWLAALERISSVENL